MLGETDEALRAEPSELSLPTSAALPVPEPPPPPQPVPFPLRWLQEHASMPLLYRAMSQVAVSAGVEASRTEWMPLAGTQSWNLLLHQTVDGTWGHGMLAVPAPGLRVKPAVGAVPAYRRLLELGWTADAPPLSPTRRLFFRLLAEDDDPAYLFEFTKDAGRDIDRIRRGRLVLREAAAAALAHAGFETDPRLRGAARRLVDRVDAFLRSPDAEKPFVRLGNQHVLRADAAPPSYALLVMLAYMPQFRSECHDFMHRLMQYLAQPMPRMIAVQQVGKSVIDQPQYVLGDPLPSRHLMDADIPSAVAWLELMARMGRLRTGSGHGAVSSIGGNDGWQKLFEKLLDDCDRRGVWSPPRSVRFPKTLPWWAWSTMPLGDGFKSEEQWAVDVTVRLGIIARLTGRDIALT